MNYFGGDWTKIKIEILVEYAKAYLTIMKNKKFYKLLYFDGFAGTGEIIKVYDNPIEGIDITIGAARRIIEVEEPRPFDEYYFVEKNPNKFQSVRRKHEKGISSKKNIHNSRRL